MKLAETATSVMRDYREHYREDWVFMPGGKESCDYWFIREGDTYHGFFLESDSFAAQREQNIGHMTSRDFLHWEYQGTVLTGKGTDGKWPEGILATGSVIRYNGRFYMLYTGHSARCGLGLAVSDDLYTWEKVGDGPVISNDRFYEAEYEGRSYTCQVLADPYLYPEAIDGWVYAYINSWVKGVPKNSRGAQLMLRTQDMVHWEPYRIAVQTKDLDRLETAQVWEHGGKWYMYFGGRRVNPDGGDFEDVESGSYIYAADRFDGPFLRQPWSAVDYKTSRYCYIQKQMVDPFGDEVAVTMTPYTGLLWPYKLLYGEDGSVTLEPNRKETTEAK